MEKLSRYGCSWSRKASPLFVIVTRTPRVSQHIFCWRALMILTRARLLSRIAYLSISMTGALPNPQKIMMIKNNYPRTVAILLRCQGTQSRTSGCVESTILHQNSSGYSLSYTTFYANFSNPQLSVLKCPQSLSTTIRVLLNLMPAMGFRPHGKSPIYRHPTRASGRGSYLKPFTNIRPERLQEIRDLLNIPGANQFEELVPDQGNIAGATREDISSYLFNLPDMSGFNAAIMLAYLCRYVNERHSPGPGHPICVAQSVIQWNFIALGRTLEVSYALKKAGVTPENFFNISHVFYLIQIQSDPSDINPFTSKTRDDQ